MIKKLAKIDKRLAGSFIVAVALAIIFFLLGVFYEKQPRLRYVILSQAPVYDVHENVPDLDIIFRSKSIRQDHQTLSVMSVRVENGGNAGLTLQSFDPNSLPGIRVTHCQIVKITPLTIGNSYLEQALHLVQRGEHEVVFGPMIFDKGDFFVLKFLLLHGEADEPHLESFGKVAGVGKIQVIPTAIAADQRGFFARALSGGLAIQAFRALAYFIAFLVCVGAIGITIAGIVDLTTQRRRKRRIRIFERGLATKPTKQQEVVLDIYKSFGAEAIVRLNELLADSESVAQAMRFYKRGITTAGRQANPHSLYDFETPVPVEMALGKIMKELLV